MGTINLLSFSEPTSSILLHRTKHRKYSQTELCFIKSRVFFFNFLVLRCVHCIVKCFYIEVFLKKINMIIFSRFSFYVQEGLRHFLIVVDVSVKVFPLWSSLMHKDAFTDTTRKGVRNCTQGNLISHGLSTFLCTYTFIFASL